MKLTWQQIKDNYVNSCGESTGAVDEAWTHLNAGLQFVSERVDVYSLIESTTTPTVASQDYVSIPSDLYSILYVYDQTNDDRLDPENGGMRGRSRFLQNDGKPPEGRPKWYVRSSDRLYLRDTPDDIYTLQIRYKKHPTEVSSSDLANNPVVPEQYHWSIVWAAAESYYMVHPSAEGAADKVVTFRNKVVGSILEPPSEKTLEGEDSRNFVQLRGYGFNIRGR